jgi:hypothetical protein
VTSRVNARPIGADLDGIGVELEIDTDDRITAAIVLTKVVDMATGTVSLGLAASDGLDWVDQLGLLQAADLVMRNQADTD